MRFHAGDSESWVRDPLARPDETLGPYIDSPILGHKTKQHTWSRRVWFWFWFLVCYAATQLANQLHQTRIQVVRSNKVARKRLTKSNGTPAMDLGHMNVVLK